MDKKFIINLQGTSFVKFEGLLDEFHKGGGTEIKTRIISFDPYIVKATVKGEKGLFQGMGDADESNVNKLIAKHKYRMAETRAIARALRWYNNIGMCSADEMGGDDVKQSNPNIEKLKKEVDEIKTKEELREFYKKNKGKGADLETYITNKSKEL